MVRVRPLLFHELEAEKVCHANEHAGEVMIYDERTRHKILTNYDIVIDENGTQDDVFTHVSTYTANFLNGYNCTIFAYGQTGTGKTHTMFGFGFSNAEEFARLE
jgi:DNA replication protein DnaC